MRFRKIFNISMHRSGTQSVHDLLVRCRISSVRWPSWVKGVNYENLVAGSEDDILYVADVLAPVFEMVTAVSDVPIPALYDTLDDMYPNSAFILVSRRPLDWIRSVRRHVGNSNLHPFERIQYWRYFSGHPTTLTGVTDTDLHSAYVSHRRNALTFFERGHNCLHVDLHDIDIGEQICRFLGFPEIPLRHIDYRAGIDVPKHVFEGF